MDNYLQASEASDSLLNGQGLKMRGLMKLTRFVVKY